MATIRKWRTKGEGLICIVISLLVIGHCAFAQVKAYDGIWFLGFNLTRPPFDNLYVRQAVAHSLNTNYISKQIVEEDTFPASVIPYSMTGYDAQLKPYKFNPKFAKSLLKKAGYKLSDRRLKSITLLHTDGEKTIAIAQRIQKDLKQIGIKVELVQVAYRDVAKWNQHLSLQFFNLFLMGYKAESELLFTEEASASVADSFRLLDPLFRTSAEANFTGFSDPTVDKLLDQASVIGQSFSIEREEKLKKINKLLYKELPVLVLFYIEKME
jgi:ABC-type transport system substrate-binding protein